MSRPRILVVMGSGETSPTMVTPHQRLFARLESDAGPVHAVTLDTPYGFQENADELTDRIVSYFAGSVGRQVEPVRFRSRAEADAAPTAAARAWASLGQAGWIFAGPGSPTYALRQWQDSPVPAALDARLRPGGDGGAVVFASAAALTLGLVTIPVYEVYKVGLEPYWCDGLDVLGRATGLRAAVVPHYDNAEGGTHDTRFCWLGERRLRELEGRLPEGAFVLGVDEHTGLVLDLDAGSAEVIGRGAVTVRARGVEHRLPTGTVEPLERLAERAGSALVLPSERDGCAADAPQDGSAEAADPSALLASGDVAAAVDAILTLDARATTTAQRDVVRGLVTRLGDLAGSAPGGSAEAVGPFVEVVLEARARARSDRRWDESDLLRDRLAALGVEVRDGPDGATWILRDPA